MGNFIAKRKQEDLQKRKEDLVRLIDADDLDGLKRLLSMSEYQKAAKDFSIYVLNARNIEIVKLFIPYINIHTTFRHAVIRNKGPVMINMLRENGAIPPLALGDPKMKCKIRRYECENKNHIIELQQLYEKVKDQADDLGFPVLKYICENSDNNGKTKTYYYVSTAESKYEGTILCGAMKVADILPIDRVEIDLLSTQAPYNPNVKAQRVGSRLVKRVINDARKAGRSKVTLFATPWAVPFYEKLGFVRANPESTEMIYEIVKQKKL